MMLEQQRHEFEAEADEERLHAIQAQRREKQMKDSEAKAAKEELKRRKCQKSVFPWKLPEKRKEDETIRLDEVVDNGIPRKELLYHLQQEIRELESCRSLPFAIFLIFIYASSAIIHENAPEVSSVEHSMEFDVEENANFAWAENMGHKTVHDVNSLTDWWSWFTLGFLPLVYIQATPFSEGMGDLLNLTDEFRPTLLDVVPDEEFDDFYAKYVYQEQTIHYFGNDSRRGLYLNFNRLLGGVRLSKIDSSEPDGCSSNEDLLKAYGIDCVGGKGYELEPEVFDVWLTLKPGPNEIMDVEWLYAYNDLETLQNVVLQMETEGWLNNQTKRVQISIPVFNAEYGLYSIMKVEFFFSRGGHIWKELVTASTWSNWHRQPSFYAVDFLFAGCMMVIIFRQFVDMRNLIKKKGFIGLASYINFWSAVDWISVFAAVTLIILLMVNLGATAILNMAAGELGSINYALPENFARYEEAVQNVMVKLEDEIQLARLFRYFMAIFPCVIILRLFKAFSAQKRLAVVTDTLTHASVDFVHFMIVFFSVFGSYMICALPLLGSNVPEFTTGMRAMNQLFRALQGDLDWDEVREAGRYEAMIFILVFNVLLSQLMFNILMAIIMDAYSEVKDQLQGAEMLWNEVAQEVRLRCGSKKNRQVKLGKVVDALSYDEKVDTLKKVCTKVSNNKTEFIVAQNAKNGKVSWECYSKTRDHLCDEMDKAYGDIIVCDGMGKQLLLQDGKLIEFNVKLDAHASFYWYTDTTHELAKGGREDKAQKHAFEAAVAAAEEGLTATGMVTIEYLVKSIEGMKDKQATNIVCKAIENFYDRNKSDPGPEDIRNTVMHLDHRSVKLLKAVNGEPKRPKDAHDTDGMLQVRVNRGTVGSELNKLRGYILDHAKLYEDFDGTDFEMKLDSIREKTATMDELKIGQTVKLLNSMRDIINACGQARLAPENHEFRKRSAGRHAEVLKRDFSDNTVCLDVEEVGELWFAPEAIVSPSVFGVPTEAEMSRREAAELDKERRREARQYRKNKMQTSKSLAEQLIELKVELEEARATAQEAKEATLELQKRVVRQQGATRKAKHAIKALQSKVDRLASSDRKEDDISRNTLSSLVDLTQSRNDYFDMVRKLTAENNKLKADLQNAKADTHVELADMKVEHVHRSRAEHDARATLKKLNASVSKAKHTEQKDLAWLAGLTDSLIKKLGTNHRQARTIIQLMDLRNEALETWTSIQNL